MEPRLSSLMWALHEVLRNGGSVSKEGGERGMAAKKKVKKAVKKAVKKVKKAAKKKKK